MFSPYSRVQNFISFLGYIYSIKSYYLIFFFIINPLKNSKLYSFSSSKICHVLRIITFIFFPVINMNAFKLFFIEVPCLVTFFFGWIWKIFHRWAIAVISTLILKKISPYETTMYSMAFQSFPTSEDNKRKLLNPKAKSTSYWSISQFFICIWKSEFCVGFWRLHNVDDAKMYIKIQMYPEDLHEYARSISLLQVRICHCSAAL